MLFIILYKMAPAEFVDEVLQCDHSDESYWGILSYVSGTVYHAVQSGTKYNDL